MVFLLKMLLEVILIVLFKVYAFNVLHEQWLVRFDWLVLELGLY
jgi:hypothetical protein